MWSFVLVVCVCVCVHMSMYMWVCSVVSRGFLCVYFALKRSLIPFQVPYIWVLSLPRH